MVVVLVSITVHIRKGQYDFSTASSETADVTVPGTLKGTVDLNAIAANLEKDAREKFEAGLQAASNLED